MKNKKQYLERLIRIIHTDCYLFSEFNLNMLYDAPHDDLDACIKCAEKTVKNYSKRASKLLSKIEKTLAVPF